MTRPFLLTALVATALLSLARADGPARAIADFTAIDISGRSVALTTSPKATVVLFLGTQCPINQLYMPRLVELHKEFAAQGVGFVGVYANRQDSQALVVEHIKKYQVPFAVIKDEGNVLADRFG